MIVRILAAGAMLASLAVPALAANSYWVGPDAATKKCSVVSTKPDGKIIVKIGKGYTTEAAAQAAMAAAPECKSP